MELFSLLLCRGPFLMTARRDRVDDKEEKSAMFRGGSWKRNGMDRGQAIPSADNIVYVKEIGAVQSLLHFNNSCIFI